MRFLPRSKRGTWALATAVWLGGCAVVWWLLPGVPRVVVPADEAGLPHGFTADGRGLYGCVYGTFVPSTDRFQMGAPGHAAPDGPFRIWDLRTGCSVLTWTPPVSVVVHHLMLEHSAALISEPGPVGWPIALFDLRTGQREVLPWTTPTVGAAYLTADGRYLLYVADKPEPYATCWWDRKTRKLVGAFVRLTPATVAEDGRWLTVDRAGKVGEPTQIAVRAPASDQIMTKIDLFEGFDSAWFSDDGGYLLIRAESGVQVIELPSGRLCAKRLMGLEFYVLPGLNQVVAAEQSDGKTAWLVRWNLATGREIGRSPTPSGFEPTASYQAPRKRYVLLGGDDSAGPWTWLRGHLANVPVLRRIIAEQSTCYTVFDLIADGEVTRIHPSNPWIVELAPDDRTLINATTDGQLEFWDIPPRKPLSWLGIAAGVWSLPVAWFAQRRVRKLASGVA